MGKRRVSDFTIRNVRYRTEHPVRAALIGAVVVFAWGFFIFDGDVRPAAAGFVAAAVVAWFLWRPGGPMARRWTERIARQALDDLPPPVDWAPPQGSPAGDDSGPLSPGG